ncbi:4a-hydroxytetrahydrobiopterin dehydratase [Patescibacteria group bacterium]|nr:4a-hydroxytetrahydrobiopterin dehydratase [Patescibacteria group bacterium]
MDKPLHEQKCVPCEGGVPSLQRDEALKLAAEVNGWNLATDAKSISHEYTFKDFNEALGFINAVGALAESEGHHPDIHCAWNKVKLELSTHAIGGLSNNDFILASKINRLPEVQKATS